MNEETNFAEAIALEFNDYINNRDVENLVTLMTDDHKFIDSENHRVEGKSNNRTNWEKFFELFPDYNNVFEVVNSRGTTVIIQDYSVCSDKRLNIKSIWTVQIVADKVQEWRVHLDNKETRSQLRI